MSSDDFDFERALPDRVPPGERILWQGAPQTLSLARRAFHVTLVAAYFAMLAGWAIATGLSAGDSAASISASSIQLAMVAASAISVLFLLAWLAKRSSTYLITSERVVMRFGVALPITINIPFRFIAAADLKTYRDGTGDIALRLNGGRFLGFIPLWPHVRAWRLAKPEPVLRALPEAKAVAETLTKALVAARLADQPDVHPGCVTPNQTGAKRPSATGVAREREPKHAKADHREPGKVRVDDVVSTRPAAA